MLGVKPQELGIYHWTQTLQLPRESWKVADLLGELCIPRNRKEDITMSRTCAIVSKLTNNHLHPHSQTTIWHLVAIQ